MFPLNSAQWLTTENFCHSSNIHNRYVFNLHRWLSCFANNELNIEDKAASLSEFVQSSGIVQVDEVL